MTKIRSMIYGIYPRSEPLRISISKWERNAISQDELQDVISREKNDLLEKFRSDGIWGYTDPLSNWNDILRGVTRILTQVNLGKLTRYKETNTFYKQPEFTGYPEFAGKIAPPDHDTHLPGQLFESSGSGYFHFLPGIDSLLNMSVIDPDLDVEKLHESTLMVYKQIIREYGIKDLVLFEPYPGDIASSVYEDLFSSTHVHYVIDDLHHGFFKEIKKQPESVVVKSRDAFQELHAVTDIPGLALFDAQNTKIEDPVSIRSDILALAESGGEDEVVVTHTEYLDFLPRIIADKKAKSIGDAGDAI